MMLKIKVAGKPRGIDCTFGDIRNLERGMSEKTGEKWSALAFVSDIQASRVQISEVVGVIHSLLAGAGHDVSEDECGESVIQGGFNDALGFISGFFEKVFTAGPTEDLGVDDDPKRKGRKN